MKLSTRDAIMTQTTGLGGSPIYQWSIEHSTLLAINNEGKSNRLSSVLYLRSEVTGVEVRYHHYDTLKDNEGDILYWRFLIAAHEVEKYPQLKNSVLRVYND